MKDKTILTDARHCQNWCNRKDRQLVSRAITLDDLHRIIEFLDEWGDQTGLGKALNDRNFLEKFFDKEYLQTHSEVSGQIFFDGDKIIGISFLTPSTVGIDGKKTAAAIIMKNLRHPYQQPDEKYAKLGEWMHLERLKFLKTLGYSYLFIGGAEDFTHAEKNQARFKKRMIANGKGMDNLLYSREIPMGDGVFHLSPEEIRSIWK